MQAVLIRRHKPGYNNLWSTAYKASLPDVQGESANMVNSHDVYHLLFTAAELSVERE
jgi:hypothetical protein